MHLLGNFSILPDIPADNFLAKCNHPMGRFTGYIKPIMSAMTSESGRGRVVYPPPAPETAPGPAHD